VIEDSCEVGRSEGGQDSVLREEGPEPQLVSGDDGCSFPGICLWLSILLFLSLSLSFSLSFALCLTLALTPVLCRYAFSNLCS
jgi:hypothetical protein